MATSPITFRLEDIADTRPRNLVGTIGFSPAPPAPVVQPAPPITFTADDIAPEPAPPTPPPVAAIPGMEKLGGSAPPPPKVKMPVSGSPQEAYEATHGPDSGLTYNRFGEQTVKPGLRTLEDAPGILAGEFTGPPKVVSGVSRMTKPGMKPRKLCDKY